MVGHLVRCLGTDCNALLLPVHEIDHKASPADVLLADLCAFPSFVLLGVVGNQVGPATHTVAFLVQELHRVAQARLQQSSVPLEQPHHYSPAHSCQHVVEVPLLHQPPLQATPLQLPIAQSDQADHHSAEEVENDLIVYPCFFAEN